MWSKKVLFVPQNYIKESFHEQFHIKDVFNVSSLAKKKDDPRKDGLVRYWWWGRDQPINLVSERVSAADNVYVKTPITVAPAVRMAFEVE